MLEYLTKSVYYALSMELVPESNCTMERSVAVIPKEYGYC